MTHCFNFRALSDIGDGNLDEPSPLLSKQWSSTSLKSPLHQHQYQPQQEFHQLPLRSNNNMEPLKILTGNGYDFNAVGSGRHHDSGYISPNLPNKAFFDINHQIGSNGGTPMDLHQQKVDPLLLQQVLQQHHYHPKQQPFNHRPITGKPISNFKNV